MKKLLTVALYFLRFSLVCILLFVLFPSKTEEREIIVLLDVSESNVWLHTKKKLNLYNFYKNEIIKISQRLSSKDKLAIVYFANKPQIVKKFSSLKSNIILPTYRKLQNKTNLIDAFHLANKMFTENVKEKKIIVFSDGLFDSSAKKKIITFKKKFCIEWHYLCNAQIKNIRDLAVVSIKIPHVVKKMQTITGLVTIRATYATFATLRIKAGKNIIYEKKVSFPKSGVFFFYFPWNIYFTGKRKIYASLHSIKVKDDCSENNVFYTEVHSIGKIKILEFGQTLNLPSFDITSFSEKDIDTKDIIFDDYDVFVISDMKAKKLERFFNKIKKYVKKGKSLFMIGGRRTFSLGGYTGTPIESILPVWCAPHAKENTLIVVLLDISGSMNESYNHVSKLDAAKIAIWQLLQQIQKGDIVKLIGFNSEIYNIFATNKDINIDKNIANIKAFGKTIIVKAIKHSLKLNTKGKKHIILISDGESSEKSILKQMGEIPKKTTLSVIATSQNTSQLRDLAFWGKGSFYDATNLQLKDFLIRDLLMLRGNLIKENAITVADENFFYKTKSFYDGVFVSKYIATNKKKWGKNVLYSTTKDSLLCLGNFVLGRSATLTVNKAWAKNLDISSITAHTLSWLATNRNIEYHIMTSYNESFINVIVNIKKKPFHNRKLTIFVPWLNQNFILRQKSHGNYEINIPCAFISNKYTLQLKDEGYFSNYLIFTIYVPYSSEFKNLNEVSYFKNTNVTNKYSKNTKNMDNTLICIAIIFFLLERFLEKFNYGF